jgi:XRE family aerobic/anaerobic benzoate catabolism transcriptional regulator
MVEAAPPSERHPFLVALGERVRMLRARRGLTRRAVAQSAQVSLRHLANLESGTGNASILILLQVANALQCPLSELLGDVTTSSPEWLLIRELLQHRSEAELQQARLAMAHSLGEIPQAGERANHIALIGLRGAGKSTLGQTLAQDLGRPFVELSAEVERIAGCSIPEIHGLYGPMAYRRYERQALEEVMARHSHVVLATPGGLVSDTATFQYLLQHCYTVWLQASPEEHMARVVAQGDTRPMAANPQAMEDLRHILQGRSAFYAKADTSLDTSGQSESVTYQALRDALGPVLKGL